MGGLKSFGSNSPQDKTRVVKRASAPHNIRTKSTGAFYHVMARTIGPRGIRGSTDSEGLCELSRTTVAGFALKKFDGRRVSVLIYGHRSST